MHEGASSDKSDVRPRQLGQHRRTFDSHGATSRTRREATRGEACKVEVAHVPLSGGSYAWSSLFRPTACQDGTAGMDEDGADESFDDPWWDDLAIDHETESQLQVAEQKGLSTPVATPKDVPLHALQAQIQEVRRFTLIAASCPSKTTRRSDCVTHEKEPAATR